jgi:hypothetical protein
MCLRTLSNVYSFVAAETGYKNVEVSGADIPLTNLTGTYPGPLNPKMLAPWPAPNLCAVGAGGGPVFVAGQKQRGSGYYNHGAGCK